MTKPEYHIVSFSGGKDSTALLLGMIDRNMRIDEVINFDTGLEFPSMYDHIDKIKEILREKNIRYTSFKSELGFEYYLLERERYLKSNVPVYGWGWPNIVNRWCTAFLKTRNSDAYIKALSEKYDIIQYIGIAADESKRLERKHHQNKKFRYPLVEWGMTEKDCLEYCYEHGYDWGGLYRIFKRVSCWCCPLESVEELYKLWDNFPDLWVQLREWDNRLAHQYGTRTFTFKKPYTVEQLEQRFILEKKRRDRNLSTRSKSFYRELDLLFNGLDESQSTLEEYISPDSRQTP